MQRRNLLDSNELKTWLHKELGRLDKLLLILGSFDSAVQLSEIREKAASAGFRIPQKWNESQVLGASKGKAVRAPDGWEITDAGKLHLRNLGVSKVSPAAMQVAVDLRAYLKGISDVQTRDFVEEAIKCHEAALFRSAIVMSWLGAMDVLHKHVHGMHLAAFNAEMTRLTITAKKKWKTAVTTDDLGKVPEGEFLDRIEALSIIGKNAKAQLKAALDLRNGCGHPNSLQVGVNKSAAHIETLLQNVFGKF